MEIPTHVSGVGVDLTPSPAFVRLQLDQRSLLGGLSHIAILVADNSIAIRLHREKRPFLHVHNLAIEAQP